jgi:hypothetical protein
VKNLLPTVSIVAIAVATELLRAAASQSEVRIFDYDLAGSHYRGSVSLGFPLSVPQRFPYYFANDRAGYALTAVKIGQRSRRARKEDERREM